MLDVNWVAFTMAMGRSDPVVAMISVINANQILPPTIVDGAGKVTAKGYRADLSEIIPKFANEGDHNTDTFTESLDAKKVTWAAVQKASALVSEAISKYAHDNKDRFMT